MWGFGNMTIDHNQANKELFEIKHKYPEAWKKIEHWRTIFDFLEDKMVKDLEESRKSAKDPFNLRKQYYEGKIVLGEEVMEILTGDCYVF